MMHRCFQPKPVAVLLSGESRTELQNHGQIQGIYSQLDGFENPRVHTIMRTAAYQEFYGTSVRTDQGQSDSVNLSVIGHKCCVPFSFQFQSTDHRISQTNGDIASPTNEIHISAINSCSILDCQRIRKSIVHRLMQSP
jgi:hypothetical protein